MSYEEEKQDRKIDQLGAEIERLRARIKELEELNAALMKNESSLRAAEIMEEME